MHTHSSKNKLATKNKNNGGEKEEYGRKAKRMRAGTDFLNSPQARTEDKPHNLFDVMPDELVKEVFRFVGIGHSSYVNRGKDYNCVRLVNRRLNELWKEVIPEAFKLEVLSQKFEKAAEAYKKERYFGKAKFEKVCKSIVSGIVNYNLEDLFDFAVEKMDQDLWSCICVKATRCGRLTLLKRIFGVLKERNIDYAEEYGELCSEAVEHGNLEILKYLHELLKERNIDYAEEYGELCSKAVEHGNLGILKYLHELLKERNIDYAEEYGELCSEAVEHGNLEILKYLHEQNFVWGPKCMMLAVMARDLNIVKFFYQEGATLTYSLFEKAVENRDEEMIEFLCLHNCPSDNGYKELAWRNYELKQRGLGNLCINMRCWSRWRK